jgi:quercetin dioxygenase-like cupin family protein
VENWKNFMLDDQSMWPQQTLVPLDASHADARGAIQSLVNTPMKNISIITSVKGSLRSNHYHKTDWHYIYMLSGEVDYYYRPTGGTQPPKVIRAKTGDMIFTPPMEDHTTIALEDSVFLAISRNPRDQEAYEADVVRVALVDPGPFVVR